MRVFCVDIGYSFELAYKLYVDGNYPSYLLYGITEFKKNGVIPILQTSNSRFKNKKIKRIADELKVVIDCFKYRKNYDVVYIPYSSYANILYFFKYIGLFNKPIVVLIHNISQISHDGIKSKIYRKVFNIMLKSIDKASIISPYSYKILKKYYPRYQNKVEFTYLPGDKNIVLPNSDSVKDIVAIGKTHRDYEMVINAVKGTDITATLVSNQGLDEFKDKFDNITVIDMFIDFKAALDIYKNARIIIVPVVETDGGIYGLSSILDAISLRKPVIVTKTKGLAIPVEELGIGMEVTCGDSLSLKSAINKILTNEDIYNEMTVNIEKLLERYNIEEFSGEICKNFKEVV